VPGLQPRTASRLWAVTIVVAIAVMITVLPRRYHVVPTWFGYAGVVAMIVPMLYGAVWKSAGPWRRIERYAEFFAVGAALFINICNLLVAAYNLIEHPDRLEPVPLFYTSVGIWVGNVLIFTLLYWLVDCGGPDARLAAECDHPDFVFPAMDDPAHAVPNWRPGMMDYLFLSFTTCTAFSPTEAMPFTGRAKMLMISQSSISLITIAIVAARCINILK
jgi:hypothetical protein